MKRRFRLLLGIGSLFAALITISVVVTNASASCAYRWPDIEVRSTASNSTLFYEANCINVEQNNAHQVGQYARNQYVGNGSWHWSSISLYYLVHNSSPRSLADVNNYYATTLRAVNQSGSWEHADFWT